MDGVVELSEGTRLDHFEIRCALGAGAFGTVYLARDTILGRRVALKVLSGARDTEHLLEEARLAAGLNHPNLVTIHAVGSEASRPYIAMEYIAGRTLGEHFAERAASEEEARNVLVSVADALAHAHAHGVVHGDLKPANIMVSTEGRICVVDFGLASHTGSGAAAGWGGTMAYLAPECLRGQAGTAAADVWALGVLVYELVERRLPYSSTNLLLEPDAQGALTWSSANPSASSAMVSRCLSFDPDRRPDAGVIARELIASVSSSAGPEQSPYRGLEAFSEEESEWFFGRAKETSALATRLDYDPLVLVSGPSGVGKSSLVLAGLLPRLRAQGTWAYAVMRPGPSPFRALALALCEAPERARALAAELETEPERLHLHLHRRAETAPRGFVLVIDQLEEVFTAVDDEGVRRQFLQSLLTAAQDNKERVRIVATIRADFLGRLPEVRGVYVVPRLGDEAVEQAVVEPARRAGYAFESADTVAALVEGLRTEATGLPALQVACQVLWDRRDRNAHVLTARAFEAVGGLPGALGAHADQVIEALPASSLPLARSIIVRLVGPDMTRRVVPVEEIIEAFGADAAGVVDALVAARLLSFRPPVDAGQSALVSLVHDAVILGWAKLKGWLEEESVELRALTEISRGARMWTERGRRDDALWEEDEVLATSKRLGAHREHLSNEASRFVEASLERARGARRRSVRRRSALVAGLVALTVGSLMLANEFRRREKVTRQQASQIALASGDIGHFELELSRFDWTPDGSYAAVAPPPEGFVWTLLAPSSADPSQAGTKSQTIRVEPAPGAAAPVHRYRVEARAGPAFLRVERVGCAPSTVPVQRLPGYSERSEVSTIAVRIPSCAASRAQTVPIPAGDFFEDDGGGEGRWVAGFRIDRFEVSNARFAPLGALSALTGIPAPHIPDTPDLVGAARPDRPVLTLNAFDAAAVCGFYGGRLPASHEWTKAARGGIWLAEGQRNPLPRRTFPWGDEDAPSRANLDGAEDGFRGLAPVHAFTGDVSPYGVIGLAGNVFEWTSTTDAVNGLRVTRGGNWATPAEARIHANTKENGRNPRYVGFSTGVRCAYDE